MRHNAQKWFGGQSWIHLLSGTDTANHDHLRHLGGTEFLAHRSGRAKPLFTNGSIAIRSARQCHRRDVCFTAVTRELHSRGELTDEERDVLAMWQFSSSGTLINVFSNGLALLPLIVVPLGNILLVIVAAKFLGANLLRLFLWTRKSKSLKLP